MEIFEEFIGVIINQTLSFVFDSACNLLVVGINSLNMYIMIDANDTYNHFVTFFIGSQLTLDRLVLNSSLRDDKVFCKLVHIDDTFGKALFELLICGCPKCDANTGVERVGT